MSNTTRQEMSDTQSQEMNEGPSQEATENYIPMEDTICERLLPALVAFRGQVPEGGAMSALTLCAYQYTGADGTKLAPEITMLAETASDGLLAVMLWSVLHNRPAVAEHLIGTITAQVLDHMNAVTGLGEDDEEDVAPI